VTTQVLQQRFGDLTADDVNRLDAVAAGLGVDTERLMEHAGWQVARCASELCAPGAPLAVIAGSGNNGGDGVVAARLLAGWGHRVEVVVFSEPEKLKPEFSKRLAAAAACGAATQVTPRPEAVSRALADCELALDALLGSGLAGPPRDQAAVVIALLSGAATLAVDVPSGLDATAGPTAGCVQALATCTLAGVKRGLWTGAGRSHAGRLYVADIGMPAAAWHACGLEVPSEVRNGRLLEINASNT
jgi:hydroxyethylthiazole kinase-like uncharacterized protein yjeF